jgi:ankyrin repeat protein
MIRIAAALILVLQAQLACAASDLIQMAAEENNLTPDLLSALKPLKGEEIDSARDAEGRTMLHWMAIRSHQARALVVLLAGASANVTDNRGRTPLFDAIEASEASDPPFKGEADFMCLEMLTLRGADVNARAADGTTPLGIAVERNHYRKAEFLIRHGAAIDLPDLPAEKSQWTIVQAIGDDRMTELLAAAMKAGSPAGKKTETPPRQMPDADEINKALTAADLKAISGFLEAGWNINEQNEKGQTALLRAVEACRPDLVSELIFKGADPNIANKDGKTPLMASVRILGLEGQRMTAMLLLKGAKVDAATKDGDTALTMAGAAGHDYGVMWLIAAGADPLAPTPKGSLMAYVSHNPTKYLLGKFGVAKTEEKPPETTPVALMFSAIRRNDLAGVERELANGVSAGGWDKKEGSAFALAASWGLFEIVDLLIEHGAQVNEQNPSTGWHVLHGLASWGPAQGDPDIAAGHIEKLIERGANPDIQSKDGMTPLMVAAKLGIKEKNTEALVKGGASLAVRNKEGLTVLGVAKKHGRSEMIEYLQSLGAAE